MIFYNSILVFTSPVLPATFYLLIVCLYMYIYNLYFFSFFVTFYLIFKKTLWIFFMLFSLSFTYTNLLNCAMHVGHSWLNTLMSCSWFILSFSQGLAIMNLFKSVVMFSLGLIVLMNIIAFSSPIWFVNLDESFGRFLRFAAYSCGEFFFYKKWMHGAVSNYQSIFNAYRRLCNLSELVVSGSLKFLKSVMTDWFLTSFTWPRLLFISNLHKSYSPAKEAFSLNIPALAISDSNAWSQSASIPVPGNDESVNSIIFYNDVVSNFVSLRKFVLMSIWFFNVKDGSRVVTFMEWILGNFSKLKSFSFSNVVSFSSNVSSIFYSGLSLYFSMNYWKFLYKEKLDMLYSTNVNLNFVNLYILFLNLKFKFTVFLSIYFFKRSWLGKIFFSKKFLVDLNFKLKFLKHTFFSKSFYTNRYLRYKEEYHLVSSSYFLNSVVYFFFLKKFFFYYSYVKVNFFNFKYLNFASTVFLDSFYVSNMLGQKFKYFFDFYLNKYKSYHMKYFYKRWKSLKFNFLLLKAKNFFLSKFVPYDLSLSFFVFDFSMESFLPKSFWLWNVNIFPNIGNYPIIFSNFLWRHSAYDWTSSEFYYNFMGFSFKLVKRSFSVFLFDWFWL